MRNTLNTATTTTTPKSPTIKSPQNVASSNAKKHIATDTGDAELPQGLVYPPPQTLHENLGTTLIIDTLCGYNSTLVAAGATGSCKSLTMFGPHKIRNRTTKEYDAGLVPWMFGQIVEAVRNELDDAKWAAKATRPVLDDVNFQ